MNTRTKRETANLLADTYENIADLEKQLSEQKKQAETLMRELTGEPVSVSVRGLPPERFSAGAPPVDTRGANTVNAVAPGQKIVRTDKNGVTKTYTMPERPTFLNLSPEKQALMEADKKAALEPLERLAAAQPDLEKRAAQDDEIHLSEETKSGQY